MKLTPRVEMLLEALLNEAGLSVGVDPRVFSHAVGEALMAMQQQRQLKEQGDAEQETPSARRVIHYRCILIAR